MSILNLYFASSMCWHTSTSSKPTTRVVDNLIEKFDPNAVFMMDNWSAPNTAHHKHARMEVFLFSVWCQINDPIGELRTSTSFSVAYYDAQIKPVQQAWQRVLHIDCGTRI